MDLPIINSCEGCGACCSQIGTPPFLYFEIEELPPHLKQEVRQYELLEPDRENSKKPCFWYDVKTKKCKEHAYRPSICRDFEIGSISCHSYRAFHNINEIS